MSTKGKRYGTKASAFYTIVQAAEPIRHPTTGDIIGRKKELIAEAAIHGKEIDVVGPDGSTIKVGNIHGHYIDTAQQAIDKGWTDEERERVEAQLDFWCEEQPAQIWHLEEARVPVPWPTYEEMQWKEIVATAAATGQLAEALQYERQNKARTGIIDALEARLAEQAADVASEEALTAV